MSGSVKPVLWHVGAIAAGAWGMIVFAQSGHFDLYAFVATLKRTCGDLVELSGFLLPLLAAGGAAYRTWGTKLVPKDSLAIETSGNPLTVHSVGATARVDTVDGTTVGKIVASIMLTVMIGVSDPVSAQPATSCALDTVFKGMTPSNFMTRAKACGKEDVRNALVIANSTPIDYQGLACLIPLQTIQAAVELGGVLTLAQSFRSANRDGFPQTCVDWVKSTARMMLVAP